MLNNYIQRVHKMLIKKEIKRHNNCFSFSLAEIALKWHQGEKDILLTPSPPPVKKRPDDSLVKQFKKSLCKEIKKTACGFPSKSFHINFHSKISFSPFEPFI